MSVFEFCRGEARPEQLRALVENPECGGYVSFEGWVRDHNEGQRVLHLEYEAYESLGGKEGNRIIAEAVDRFGVTAARCVHSLGELHSFSQLTDQIVGV